MSRERVTVDPRELRRDVEPLDVLLVDDNEQWARFMADKLEAQDSPLEVTVALSANEAMLTLRERDSVDCFVADYRMPEIDGLQLLERVREEWPTLPFVLITGEGSEDIASKAIDAGVTDYLIKDPSADQTKQFVNKIQTAVEQNLLQRAIEESEERYRTVIEQGRDAVAIVRDGEMVFYNQRLADLVGDDRGELERDTLLDVVHPDDQETVEGFLDQRLQGTASDSVQDVRLVTEGGDVRYCEWTGKRVVENGEPAVLVSIRDVTEHKERERKLQWERELNRALQTSLVDVQTRAELERTVTELLVEYGYALAWIGDASGDTVRPRAVDGDRSYVDTLAATNTDTLDSEPSVWAARRDSPQFIADFEDLFRPDWRDTAIESGYRSGAALPLTYNNVTHGVLAVYHDSPGRFDETEQQLLTELADTVAFALHTLETRVSLAADRILDVQLQVHGTAYYLSEILSTSAINSGDASVTVHGTVPHGDDELLQYVTLDGLDVEQFRTIAADHSAVGELTMLDEETDRLQLLVTEPTPESELAAFGAVVRSTTVTAGQADVSLELAAREAVEDAVDTVEETFGSAGVVSIVERDSTPQDVTENELTDKQAAALEAAYYHGYFDQPRGSSATEIAETLGVTHSTFLQHLRTAQRKVFGRRFK